MRILLVMRGIPGCGKSTWIKEHELEAYTLSPDNIRLLFSAPELGLDGKYHISAIRLDDLDLQIIKNLCQERLEEGSYYGNRFYYQRRLKVIINNIVDLQTKESK